MDNYEMFKLEVLSSLPENITLEELSQILDQLAAKYVIEKQTTDIIVADGFPKPLEFFLVAKGIEGLSKGTLNLYKLTLINFFKTVRKPINQITSNDIRVYLYNYKAERNICNCTQNLMHIIINGFFIWAVNEGIVDKNPCAVIKSIKKEDKPREALTPVELEYIRKACNNAREKALVDFLYSTACRVSEVTNAKISNINWEEHSIKIEHGKGNKTRKTYLNAECEVSLKTYLLTRSDKSDYLFIPLRAPIRPLSPRAIQNMINIICDRVKDKLHCHVHPHIFRHTAATIALHNGMPIEQVKQFLGHESIRTTIIYAKTNESEIKNSHEKYV